MIDPVVPSLVGVAVPIVAVLGRLAHRSAVLRARSRLTRAAAELPVGVRISATDSAGAWFAGRDREGEAGNE